MQHKVSNNDGEDALMLHHLVKHSSTEDTVGRVLVLVVVLVSTDDLHIRWRGLALNDCWSPREMAPRSAEHDHLKFADSEGINWKEASQERERWKNVRTPNFCSVQMRDCHAECQPSNVDQEERDWDKRNGKLRWNKHRRTTRGHET